MPLQNVLFVVFGLGVVWIYWIVSGGVKGPDAPTDKPHILKVTFENGYRTEFFCDSFDQGLDILSDWIMSWTPNSNGQSHEAGLFFIGT